MESIQLIFTVIIFILCSVLTVVLAMTGKARSKHSGYYIVAIHFSVLALYIMYVLGTNRGELDGSYRGYIFLSFFCSGLISFGWILRGAFPVLLKIYFGIFLTAIAVFIIRPSIVIYVLGTGRFQKPEQQEFYVDDKLYMQEQQSLVRSSAKYPLYKIVRKSGAITKSLSRDIDFEGKVDSIKILDLNINESRMSILGYIYRVTPLETFRDSVVCDILLGYEADEITVNRKP